MATTPLITRKDTTNTYKPVLVNTTYLLAFILATVWAIAFFGFHAGNAIHLLLAMAMVTIVVNIVRGA